jgi:hypothetical protein
VARTSTDGPGRTFLTALTRSPGRSWEVSARFSTPAAVQPLGFIGESLLVSIEPPEVSRVTLSVLSPISGDDGGTDSRTDTLSTDGRLLSSLDAGGGVIVQIVDGPCVTTRMVRVDAEGRGSGPTLEQVALGCDAVIVARSGEEGYVAWVSGDLVERRHRP